MLKKIFTKKIISVVTAITLIVASITYVSAYSSPSNPISLQDDEITISQNSYDFIQPVINFGEYYSYNDLKWFSTNTDVVTVNKLGVVVGVSQGTAEVFCTLQTKTSRQHTVVCEVTVEAPLVEAEIKTDVTEVLTGDTVKYEGNVTTKKDIDTTTTWDTTNSTVAVIDKNGNLTARNEGLTEVEYQVFDEDGKMVAQDAVELEVKEAVTSLEINYSDDLEWNIGKTGTIEPEITSNDDSEKEIKYTTSNSNVATVDSKGKITAKNPGTATITVQVLDKETQRILDVVSTSIAVYTHVEDIDLNKTTVEIAKGDKYDLDYEVSPSNATTDEVTWTSSDTSIATVSSKGTITAKKSGKVTITCKSVDGVGTSQKASVIVYLPAEELVVTSTKTTVDVGKSINLGVSITPSNSYNTDVVWKVSNSTIASISSTGKLTGKKAGTVIIRATSKDSGEVTDTHKITITEPKSYTDDDLYCMAAVIYQEAGALYMSDELQLLVGSVVMNHVKSDYFPDTIRGVLTRPYAYGTMAWDGISLPTSSNSATQQAIARCYENAEKVLTGQYDIPDNVIYQAGFRQGSGVYKYIEGVYFCYQ